MNTHGPVVTTEAILQQLSETMRQVSSFPERTPEQAAEVLEMHFNGHLFIAGRFLVKPTIWGFSELVFEGVVLEESITHSLWCY